MPVSHGTVRSPRLQGSTAKHFWCAGLQMPPSKAVLSAPPAPVRVIRHITGRPGYARRRTLPHSNLSIKGEASCR